MRKLWKRIIAYGPELLVLFFCGALFVWGICRKEGYHMDELLSFELANAEFNPWIVPTQPQGRLAKFVENEIRGDSAGETLSNLADNIGDVLKNRGSSKLLSYRADVYDEPVWIDRQRFAEYITVDGKDAFHYLSVYFNVKDDNHPPLHFMVLHTVSSVFQGRIAPWMGCAVNLVFVLGILLLLMRLGKDVMTILGQESAGRLTGILAALLYGISGGALATVLLIRMYAMLTFWCVALLAVHIRRLYARELCGGTAEKAGFRKRDVRLVLVTALGFWTQYFFLFYCLILAGCTALFLWRKRRGELWFYVRSMAMAAVVGVGLFPFSIADVFSSGRGVEALQNLREGLAGYGERLLVFLKILLQSTGGFVLPVILLCSLVFWGIGRFRRVPGNGWLGAFLLLPTAGYFLLAARMAPYLVDRYIMPLFPLLVLVCVIVMAHLRPALLSGGAEGDKRERFAGGAVLTALLVCRLAAPSLWYGGDYLYRGYRAQEEVAERYAGIPCICVYEGVGYYENLVEFTYYGKTLLLTLEELENRADAASVEELDRVVVLVKQRESEAKVEDILREKYKLQLAEKLLDAQDPEADELFLYQRGEAEKR